MPYSNSLPNCIDFRLLKKYKFVCSNCCTCDMCNGNLEKQIGFLNTYCVTNLPYNFLLPVNCVVHSYTAIIPFQSARFHFQFSHLFSTIGKCIHKELLNFYRSESVIHICVAQTQIRYTHITHASFAPIQNTKMKS